MLALFGADNLTEMRRQVEGYPYERIADAYVKCVLEGGRARRTLPKIEMDRTPFMHLHMPGKQGGPSVVIRTSGTRDVIRLRGIPFNQPFARLANDAIDDAVRRALTARLPILKRARPTGSGQKA